MTASGPRHNATLTMLDVTTRLSPASLVDPFAHPHAEGILGRIGQPFGVPVFFEDPPTPPAPTPPAPTPPAPTPPAPTPPAPAGTDLAVLQQQIDAAKAAGGAEALKPFMTLVGVTTEDELKARLGEWKQADDARKSAEQRALEAQQTAQRTAEEANAGKATSDVNLLKTHALIRAGITDADQLNGLLDLVKIEGDATAESAMAAVERTKATFPALFAAAPTPPVPPTPPAPSSRAPQAPPAPTGIPPADPLAAGRERAKKEGARRQGATKDDLLKSFATPTSPLAPTA